MIASLKPYPRMKDSGLSWLGQVPEHWEIRPAFSCYRTRAERNIGVKEKTVLSLSYGRIIVRPPERLRGLVPETFESYQIVDPGDIILRSTDLQNDHTSLRVGHVKQRGIITAAYVCLTTLGTLSPEYGYHYLNAWDLTKGIYAHGSGLRQSLGFRHFRRMPVAVPPTSEQEAIVRFLDYVDHRINRYIRAKQKLIKLLEEEKQAIISQVVTRGLDSSVRLKPSGVAWLGDIPEHWSMVPNRGLFSRRKEIVGESHSEHSLLSLTLRGIVRRDIESAKGKFPASFESYQVVCPGDFVFCLFDIDETPRTVARSRLHGMVTGAYTVLRPTTQIPDYLFYYYLSLDLRKGLRSEYTGLRKVIPEDRFLRLRSPQPPTEEQQRIVSFLDDTTSNVDKVICSTKQEIQLVVEYRTRLIFDVVTGKLDLRAIPFEETPCEGINEMLLNDDAAEDEHLLDDPAPKLK